MLSLVIDTCTERGVIALFEKNEVLYQAEIPFGLNNSKYALTEIEKGFKLLNRNVNELLYIAVGIGPGSYTGIRVGVIIAKSLAFALKIPIVTLTSLDPYLKEEGICAIIDAKIGGFYVQKQIDSTPEIVTLSHLEAYLQDTVKLRSPHIAQLKEKIESQYPGKWEIKEMEPDIDLMGKIAGIKYADSCFTDINQIDLLYLRKTQAEIERDKISFA